MLVVQVGLGVGEVGVVVSQPNISTVKIAKPSTFNGKARQVLGFLTAYKLYIRMKMRGVTVEKQIQWVLSYMQGGLADVWKGNILKNLEECY